MAQLVPTKVAISTASQDSRHVHSMSWLCSPTSHYPTYFASTKPILKMDCANWRCKLETFAIKHQLAIPR